MLECSNGILGSLPLAQRARLLECARHVTLPKSRILQASNAPIESVYFLESGLACVVNPLSDGSASVTGLCGAESMIGLPVFLGDARSITETHQQIAGTAWELSTEALLEELDESSELRDALGRFALSVLAYSSQMSVCVRRHTIEERFVHLLLQVDDRVGSPLTLTQATIAQMLGVRRATITEIAFSLQQAGVIDYARGHITIQNRAALLQTVCECYAIIRSESTRLLAPAGGWTASLADRF
jgi:CRP-like cAMP-binding protein